MAKVRVAAGNTDVSVQVFAKPGQIPPGLQDPPGGLYPLKSSAWEIDEYRILEGWPVPVPDYDIRCNVLVSADDGASLDNRDPPVAITTGADFRWLADVDYWDATTLTWTSIQGEAPPWTAAPGRAPTLVTDYEYAIDDERFTSVTALNFDSDTKDYLLNDLGTVIGGATGYTVIMAMNPNSIYGDDATVVEKALWGPPFSGDPDNPFPDGHWTMFSVVDRSLSVVTEIPFTNRLMGPAIGDCLATLRPCYFALVVRRPSVAIYVGTGPNDIRLKTVNVGGLATDSQITQVWLGDAAPTYSGTMDMAFFDLNIYGR